MSGLLNIPIDAGATRRLALTVTVDGEPVDFTGAKITFLTAWYSQVLDVAGNVLTLELSPYETKRLYKSKYVIDAEFPSGDVQRLLSGFLLVNRYPDGER